MTQSAQQSVFPDNYMIDLSDRCFFIHDGLSRGTKAGYDYAVSRAKPADIRVFTIKDNPERNTLPASSAKTSDPVLHTIEMIIDVTECDHSHHFEGIFGLRALDGRDHLLYDAQQIIQIESNTSDGARMQTIIAGLERPASHLKTDTAPYCLHIHQSSKNIDGWLAHGWKRNVPEVQRLSPVLVSEIIDHCIFVGLGDMGKVMPEFEEVPVPISPDSDLAVHLHTGLYHVDRHSSRRETPCAISPPAAHRHSGA